MPVNVVVSVCSLCGSPVYGPQSVESGYGAFGASVQMTCNCQALLQAEVAARAAALQQPMPGGDSVGGPQWLPPTN